jgi:hypothetical protein
MTFPTPSRRSWVASRGLKELVRAGRIARYLAANGLARQDKVTQYLYNTPEYLNRSWRASRARLSAQYELRYGPDELVYLWENGDVACVVFHGTYARLSKLIDRVPSSSGCGWTTWSVPNRGQRPMNERR